MAATQGFIQKLDTLFTADSAIQTGIPDISGLIGQYSQGDEQCHHVAYLYDYAGAPYKTQQRVRQAMSTLYNDTPAGQCGNVDCGQMAAWYVFSALGFYPVNPGSGVYAIGSPVVSKAVIHLDREKYHGRTFTVLAEKNSSTNIYIQSATFEWPAAFKALADLPRDHLRRHVATGLWDRSQTLSGARFPPPARRQPCPPISNMRRFPLPRPTNRFVCRFPSG